MEVSRAMWSEGMPSGESGVAREGAGERVPRLRDLADEALRCALRSALRSAQRDDRTDDELRAVLRRLSERAIAGGLQAEQLLLVLKAGWREMPEARHLPARRAGDTLGHVVTLCIREFYGQRSDD
jgi:hypothetical protein